MAEDGKGCSMCCKIFFGCCCCCCLILVALGIAMGVLFSNVTEPEVDVKNVYFTGMSVDADRVKFHMDIEIFVDNPNDWPITGELEKLVADAWSLKNITREGGDDKEPVYLGQGTLKEPFKLETQSQGTFNVLVDVNVVRPDSAKLYPRFRDDCCIHGNSTNLRAKLLEGVVKLSGQSITLPSIEVDDIAVPCSDMFDPSVCAGMKASHNGNTNGNSNGGNLLR